MIVRFYRVDFEEVLLSDLSDEALIILYKKESKIVSDTYKFLYKHYVPTSVNKEEYDNDLSTMPFETFKMKYPMFCHFSSHITEDEMFLYASLGAKMKVDFNNSKTHYVDERRLISSDTFDSILKVNESLTTSLNTIMNKESRSYK